MAVKRARPQDCQAKVGHEEAQKCLGESYRETIVAMIPIKARLSQFANSH